MNPTWWDDAKVIDDDANLAQARELVRALSQHIETISQNLEAAEQRSRRIAARGATNGQASELRRELYEAHRLIDTLHRRFPALPQTRATSA